MVKDDLTVDGPGSPISVRKFVEQNEGRLHELTVLINGTGDGMAYDDPTFMYMTVDARRDQAYWFVDNCFDGRKIPGYLFRYLHYLFVDEGGGVSPRWVTDEQLLRAVQEKEIGEDHPDWKRIINLVRYCKSNPEAAQMIGFITLFYGTLYCCKRDKAAVRLFIQEPETHLHPRRERLIMCMILSIRKELGLNNLDDQEEL